MSLQDVIILTPYGVETRYPGEMPDVPEERAESVCELARKVQQVILGALGEQV